MLPDRTTTMGEGESVIRDRPFHIWYGMMSMRAGKHGQSTDGWQGRTGNLQHTMKALERMRAKLRTWAANWRGFWRPLSMAVVVGVDNEFKLVIMTVVMLLFLVFCSHLLG
jgi:hypothetical protein